MRPTKLTIDLGALHHNLKQVRHHAPHSGVMAMVKADGYGHGLCRVAAALPDIDAIGVACVDEAIRLRDAGVTTPIVLVEGLFYREECDDAVHHHFTIVIHHYHQLDMLEKSTLRHPLSAWIKLNTGMCRLGFAPSDAENVHQRVMACKNVKKPVGWMTHFGESDLLESDATRKQSSLFQSLIKPYKGPRSLANSAGILAWPDTHADWVRPGIMLYGISPFANQNGIDHHLSPVMTLSAELIAVQNLKKGDKVGYAGTYTAPGSMRMGVVSAGYGDGYPQFAKNGTPVLVNGKPCPLVGRVSMDMLTVDLNTVPDAKVGDSVTLWGKGLPVEIIAAASNTSAYELVTRMTHRPLVDVLPPV